MTEARFKPGDRVLYRGTGTVEKGVVVCCWTYEDGVEEGLNDCYVAFFGADVCRDRDAFDEAALEAAGLEGHSAAIDLRLQKIRRARREREAAREAEM